MLPYVLIFLMVFIPTLKNDTSKVNLFWYYTLTFVLILFSGFRDMIGGYDVYIYGEVFEGKIPFIRDTDAFEIGFRMFFLFLRTFSDDRYFMFFIVALIYLLGQAYVIKKYSPLVYLSFYIIFCKFYLMSFVYLRQELAMLVCWLAIPFVLEKKYIKFFGAVFIALLLHKSALLFAPLYFMGHIKFTKLQMVLLVIVTIVVSLTPLSDFLILNLASTSEEIEEVERYYEKSTGVNIFYFLEIMLLFAVLLYYKNQFYANKKLKVISNGYFLYILITILAITNGAFIRFNWYFLPFVAIGLSYFIVFIKKPNMKRLFKTAILVYFGLLSFRLLFNWDGGDLMPYKTFFEDWDRNGMFDWMEYRLYKKSYGF